MDSGFVLKTNDPKAGATAGLGSQFTLQNASRGRFFTHGLFAVCLPADDIFFNQIVTPPCS